MKDKVFNGIPVPRDCVFCKYHPSNAAKTGGTQPTDVQQLKAEIAALISKCFCGNGPQRVDESGYFLTKLRQLSAV